MVGLGQLNRTGHPHGLTVEGSSPEWFQCNVCQAVRPCGTLRQRCTDCNYDECGDCMKESLSLTTGHCVHCPGAAGRVCECPKACPRRPPAAACRRPIHLLLALDRGSNMHSQHLWPSVQRGVRAAKARLGEHDTLTISTFAMLVLIKDGYCDPKYARWDLGTAQACEFPLADFESINPVTERDAGFPLEAAMQATLLHACELHGFGDPTPGGGGGGPITCVVLVAAGMQEYNHIKGGKQVYDAMQALLRDAHTARRNFKVFIATQSTDGELLNLRRLAMVGDTQLLQAMPKAGFDAAFEHVFAALHM